MAGAEGPSEIPPSLPQHTLPSEPLFSRMVQAGAASIHLPAISKVLTTASPPPGQALLNGAPLQEDPSREVPAAHSQHQDSYPVPLAPTILGLGKPCPQAVRSQVSMDTSWRQSTGKALRAFWDGEDRPPR